MRIMRRGPEVIATLGCLCVVTGCAVSPPRGPTVMALPKPGMSLALFQQQDQQCRNYAAASIGYTQPGQAGTQAAVGSAAVGTLLGAAAGSAIGAAAGNAGAGAAIGAATGLVGGTAVGANNASASEYDLQTRYNVAYTQCMYSLGNTVQSPPPGPYGYYAYADYGYPWYGYPWYDWGWPGFFAGGVFVVGRGHEFHHHFHEGFHEGFQRPFGGGFNGGFHGGGGFHH
jgi:Glycine-zipper domain